MKISKLKIGGMNCDSETAVQIFTIGN